MSNEDIRSFSGKRQGKDAGAGEATTAKVSGNWLLQVIESGSLRFDWFCVAALMACGLCLFGPGSRLLGFSADDAIFLRDFKNMSVSNAIRQTAGYVPGRNLHMVWQYLIFLLTGGVSLESLPAQHWLQALFTSGNAALLFLLLRRLSLQIMPSAAAAWLFLLGPTHGEVHFWLSAMPMNLISTFFALCLALSASSTIRAAARGDKARATRLLALDSAIFVGGAFTYDQPVPVLVILMLTTVVTVIWLRHELALMAFSTAALVCAVPLFIMVWKMHVPGNGPSFAQVNMAHIVEQFHRSVDLVYGQAFRKVLFERTLPFSTPEIRAESAWFSAAFVGLGCICIWGDDRTQTSASALSLKRLLLLLLGAVCFFLLAYFPNYLWFISPRHTYLPGIGVACGVGVLLAALLSVLRRNVGARGAAICGVALVGGIAGATYLLVQSSLVEKEAWILSYQARQDLYNHLCNDQKFLSASLMVFDSVPLMSPFGFAPLGYQQGCEPFLLTRGATKVRHLRPFSLPTPTGDFIYVEPDEWGKDSFVHIPAEEIFRIHYAGLDREKRRFRLAESIPHRPLATVDPIEEATGDPEPLSEPRLARTGPGTFELRVPPTQLLAGEVLAAVPLVGDGPGAEPLTSQMPGGRPFMVVLEIPVTDQRRPTHVRLQLYHSLPEVKGVSLFAVGTATRRPLGQTFLAR